MDDQPLNPKRIGQDGQHPIGPQVLDLEAAWQGHGGDMGSIVVETPPVLLRLPGWAKVAHPDQAVCDDEIVVGGKPGRQVGTLTLPDQVEPLLPIVTPLVSVCLVQPVAIGVKVVEPAWPSPQIPETAIVGEPLPVTVWTGDRGCSEYAFTRGGATGQSGSIIPYDYLTLTEGIDCADDLQFIEHRTTLVFDEPGTAEITVWYSVGRMDRPEEYMGDGRKVYTVEVKEAG